MIVKSVGVLSVGKVFFCLYAVMGLIIGAVVSLLALAGAAVAQGRDQGLPALLFGVGAVVIIPIFYGAIGFVGGIIMAAVYNVVAAMVGGIEINLVRGWEERSEQYNDQHS